MNREELQKEIDELELAVAEEEFGSYSYDVLSSELEYLYLKLDKIGKKVVDNLTQ